MPHQPAKLPPHGTLLRPPLGCNLVPPHALIATPLPLPHPLSGSCSDAAAILSAHNTYRFDHQAPIMVWDTALEAAATSWAQGLANRGCSLQHGGMPANTGQNLYASYVSTYVYLHAPFSPIPLRVKQSAAFPGFLYMHRSQALPNAPLRPTCCTYLSDGTRHSEVTYSPSCPACSLLQGGGAPNSACLPGLAPWYDEGRQYTYSNTPYSTNSGR